MAGSVLQRVVFVERTADGFFRFADWALTTTTLGVMAEPFTPRQHVIPGDKAIPFDATDDLSLISEIHYVNSDLIPTRLSGGGGPVVHGGHLMPRTGR
jgi:hypothetical protein